MGAKVNPKELGAYKFSQDKLDRKGSEPDGGWTAALTAAEEHAERLAEELDALRKRHSRENAELLDKVQFDTIMAFLPVFDHFDLALAAASDSGNVAAIIDGMNLIRAEFFRTLEALGVETLRAVGEDFDPKLHEAVAAERSSEYPAGKVCKQWKAGYKIGERLLRPATVVVSEGR